MAAHDLRNLRNATEITVLFADNERVIRRFTSPVGRIVHLGPGDEGRLLAHLGPNLRRGTLLPETQLVPDRLMARESQVQTGGGEWFALRIRPYRTRTFDNYIGGAVVTCTPINELTAPERRQPASAWPRPSWWCANPCWPLTPSCGC